MTYRHLLLPYDTFKCDNTDWCTFVCDVTEIQWMHWSVWYFRHLIFYIFEQRLKKVLFQRVTYLSQNLNLLSDRFELLPSVYWGWLPFSLIDQHTCVSIMHTCLRLLPTNIYAYLSELTQKHFCLPFLPYISRLTNWPKYLSTSLG